MRLIELQIERPKSDKNFPRNIMTQIRKGDIQDSPFEYSKEKIEIDKLMPVQNQRVQGMHDKARKGFSDGSIRPIVVDKNNFIVNGHHRFDVALQMGIKKVKILRVDATIEELIDAVMKAQYVNGAGPASLNPANISGFVSIKSKLNSILSKQNYTI